MKRHEINIDFMKICKVCLIVSACIIAAGLIFNVIFGTELDISFKGGTQFKYTYTGTINEKELNTFFGNAFGMNVETDLSASGDQQLLNVYCTQETDLDTQVSVEKAVKEQYPDNAFELLETTSLSPTVGTLFFIKCLVATLLAGVFLVVYVAFRFRKIGGWSAGLMSLMALAHDLMMAYLAFVIFRIPLNDNFVAVLLTILGYSLNDTIVIFDRIRENRRKMDKKTSVGDVVNLSLRQSFYRTMNTTVTTFVAVAVLVIVALSQGLDSIISFALPMLIGIVSGFYSSVFLCTPLWAKWMMRREKRRAQKDKAPKKA